jgi:hypothetical protein
MSSSWGPLVTVDDALSYLVECLRKEKRIGQNGYDVYTQSVIDMFLIERERLSRDDRGDAFRDRGIEISPYFLSAAWELCRRGVLRPGLISRGHGDVGHNEVGAGYSVTKQGRVWVDRAGYEELATVIPGRFLELLTSHEKRFGRAFVIRGAEAIRCYSAHAFLACCAMCGAAVEAIVLAIALERLPENDVWKIYESAGGRGKLVEKLMKAFPDHVKREFQGYTALMTYWRDEAAHGQLSSILESEAFTSLLLLLRFSRYADDLFPTMRP